MESVNRWIAKRRRFCQITALFFWIAIQILLLSFNIPSWLVTFVVVFALTVTFGAINAAPAASLKKEIKTHTEYCDPFPMISSIADLLKYRHGSFMRLCLNIDYCNALNNAGEYQSAWERLTKLDINKIPGTFLNIKVLYLLTLYESCINLGMEQQAAIYFDNAILIYNNMKENKAKKSVEETVIHAHADMALRHGDWETAYSLLSTHDNKSLLAQVFSQLMLARCYLQEGNRAQARSALQFVIQNGNKLHAVHLANDILMKL